MLNLGYLNLWRRGFAVLDFTYFGVAWLNLKFEGKFVAGLIKFCPLKFTPPRAQI